MSDNLEPLKQADLPERLLPFWKMTGPGAVLVGLSIGAGELIIWPGIAARYGGTMIWAAVIGVFLQLWINLEIGRWAVATGESAYAGYGRMWKGFAWAFMAFNIFGWIMPGWARTSGLALKALMMGPNHASPDWFWTAITFGMVALALFGPKRIYSAVEKIVSALVLIVTAGLIFVAFKVGTWESLKELLAGMVNFGARDPGFDAKKLFSAMVFAGAGGTANLFYAFYLRDKHIGMGARIPALMNPFRKREEKASQSGYIFPADAGNLRRFHDWFRFVILDQILYFWLLNTFTMMLFIFGALAVLHPAGIVPADSSFLWDEAQILERSMGVTGRYLFLVIGLATLFSTQITLVDGVARSMGDILVTSFKRFKSSDPGRVYAFWAWFMIVSGVLLTAWMEKSKSTGGFLFNAGYIGGFAMAVFTPLTLWMNMRHLPKEARPRPLNIVMVSIASVVYVGFAVVCLWGEARNLMGLK